MENQPNPNILNDINETRIKKIKEEIKTCNEQKIELQKQLDELNNKNISSNRKILSNEISELTKILANPESEHVVEEKEEVLKNLSYFSNEYKSIIKEIQDALKIIRKQP